MVAVFGRAPNFLTGNFGLGLLLIVRSLLRPRLEPALLDPMSRSMVPMTDFLASGGKGQDWACVSGFHDFHAVLEAESVGINAAVQSGSGHHFTHHIVGQQ